MLARVVAEPLEAAGGSPAARADLRSQRQSESEGRREQPDDGRAQHATASLVHGILPHGLARTPYGGLSPWIRAVDGGLGTPESRLFEPSARLTSDDTSSVNGQP